MSNKLERQPTFCGCGCGEIVKPGNKYIFLHHNRGSNYWRKKELQQLCACGCNGLTSGRISQVTKKPVEFITYHASRGVAYWKRQDTPKLCKCGCKELAKPGHRFIKTHQKRTKTYWKEQEAPQLCKCNCGNLAKPGDIFIHGHNAQGKIAWNRGCKYWGKQQPPKLCKCDCGGLARPGNNFIHGHHSTGKASWNKGLTKETSEGMRKISKACKSKLGSLSSAWRGGITKIHYSLGFSKHLKFKIRKRDNFICQHCGITEEELNRALSVHHVDYNKKNHYPFNLVSLCCSCHGKTGTKRNMWIRYFQEKILIKSGDMYSIGEVNNEF